LIELNIRDRNTIVGLTVPGKAPIRSSPGSPYFYSSMELLCVALGACFGGEMVRFCARNAINPAVFESLSVTMEEFKPIIIVQYPTTLTKEQLDEIVYLGSHCQVSKMLSEKPIIKLIENTLPIETLVDETKKRPCCGG